MIEKAVQLIEAQQQKEKGRTVPWMVGEQLKDIVRRVPAWAELVAQDLEHGGHTLREAERRIEAHADKHKTGNSACVTPAEAEGIIREYFGLTEIPAAAEVIRQKETAAEGKVIDLADFF